MDPKFSKQLFEIFSNYLVPVKIFHRFVKLSKLVFKLLKIILYYFTNF